MKECFLETSLSRLEIISCYLLGTVFQFSSHLKDSAVINKDKKVKANLYLQITLGNVALRDSVKK